MDDEENEIEDEDMVNEKSSLQSANKNINKEKLSTANLQPKAPGTKQRRRSKNDCYGRDYVCGCGKTYLSYPALYTHIKTKHNGKTPEGTNANQVQSGRGRGRPRKNFLVNDDQLARKKRESSRQEASLEDRNPEIKDFLMKNNINSDQLKENEDNYLRIYESFGLLNPNNDDDNEGSEENDYSNDNEDDEYKRNDIEMKDLTYKNNNEGSNNYSNAKGEKHNEEEKVQLFPITEASCNPGYEGIKRQIEALTNKDKAVMNNNKNGHNKDDKNDEKNNKITCDCAIASFLIEMSEVVTVEFYKMIIILLKHYRDCMNKLGWEILAQHKYLHDEQTGQEYCTIKDPSRFPEIANDFFNEYLPIHLPNFDKYFAVVIISHFNFWLFKNNHTMINLKLKDSE